MKIFPIAFAVLAWVSLPEAQASDAVNSLQVQLSANKIFTDASGVERVLPAVSVRPGDIVEYRATYQNKGTKNMRDVRAMLPIPVGGMEYLPEASSPRLLRASVDGKHFDAIPLQRVIRLDKGKQQLQPVPLSAYRFLRWHLGDVGAGKSVTISSRMRVIAMSGMKGEPQ